MASLFFTCPTTHQQAPTGIETDVQSLRAAWKATLNVKCPHCGEVHEISVRETYINENVTRWRCGRAVIVLAFYLDRAGISVYRWSGRRLYRNCLIRIGPRGSNICLTRTWDAKLALEVTAKMASPQRRRGRPGLPP